jgi:hypothetical protein
MEFTLDVFLGHSVILGNRNPIFNQIKPISFRLTFPHSPHVILLLKSLLEVNIPLPNPMLILLFVFNLVLDRTPLHSVKEFAELNHVDVLQILAHVVHCLLEQVCLILVSEGEVQQVFTA